MGFLIKDEMKSNKNTADTLQQTILKNEKPVSN